MQLRPHQQVGLDALSKYNKGQVIVPTGGGKTLIAIMDAVRRLKDQDAESRKIGKVEEDINNPTTRGGNNDKPL